MRGHIHTFVDNLQVHVCKSEQCIQHTYIQYCHCFNQHFPRTRSTSPAPGGGRSETAVGGGWGDLVRWHLSPYGESLGRATALCDPGLVLPPLWWRECAQPDLSGQLVLTVVLTEFSSPFGGSFAEWGPWPFRWRSQQSLGWCRGPCPWPRCVEPRGWIFQRKKWEVLLWCPTLSWDGRWTGVKVRYIFLELYVAHACLKILKSQSLWHVWPDFQGYTTLVLGSDRCGCSGPTASRVASGCQRQLARGSVSKMSQNLWTHPT